MNPTNSPILIVLAVLALAVIVISVFAAIGASTAIAFGYPAMVGAIALPAALMGAALIFGRDDDD
jgi:hypothetical protein